jgi:hypothetical protein
VFLEDVRQSDPGFRVGLLESLSTVGFRDEVEIVSGLRQPLAIFHGSDDQVINPVYLESIPVPTLWRGRGSDDRGGWSFSAMGDAVGLWRPT